MLLEEGACYDQCSLGKTLLAFALFRFVLQGQTSLFRLGKYVRDKVEISSYQGIQGRGMRNDYFISMACFSGVMRKFLN